MAHKFIEAIRIPATWLFGLSLFFVLLFNKPGLEETTLEWLDGVFITGACLLAVIGVIGRLWSSLFVGGYKNAKLIVDGPYSLCRNPLYYFSFLGAVGVGLATETFTVPCVIAVVFWIYYTYVIKAEEKRLLEIFGDEFVEYKKRVPAFFMNPFKKQTLPETWVVSPKLFLRRAYDAIWFVAFIGFLELVEHLHHAEILPYYFHLM